MEEEKKKKKRDGWQRRKELKRVGRWVSTDYKIYTGIYIQTDIEIDTYRNVDT